MPRPCFAAAWPLCQANVIEETSFNLDATLSTDSPPAPPTHPAASEDHEKGVLTRLKQQCGAQFTSKVRVMAGSVCSGALLSRLQPLPTVLTIRLSVCASIPVSLSADGSPVFCCRLHHPPTRALLSPTTHPTHRWRAW